MAYALRKYSFVLILAISLLVGFCRSWDKSVIFTDELFIEDAAFTIAHGGTFWLPAVNWEIYIAKPPLLYWLYAPLYILFPPQPWVLRAWMVVFGALLIAVTYLLARSWFGEKVAFLTSFLLTFSWPFVYFTKTGNFDLPNAFFTVLTVYFYNRSSASIRFLIFTALSLGLGILNRSFLALIPFSVIGIDILIFKKKKVNLKSAIFSAALLFIIVLPWHLAVYLHNPREFMNQYLSLPISQHALGVVKGDLTTSVFYYLSVIWMFPVIILALALFVYLAFIKKDDILKFRKYKRAIVQLVAWIFIPSLILSLSDTRHEWYIIPVYPALAILCSFIILQGLKQLSPKRLVYHLTTLVLIILSVAPVFALVFLPLPQAELITAVEVLDGMIDRGKPIYTWNFSLLPVTRFYPGRQVRTLDNKSLDRILLTERSVNMILRLADLEDLNSQSGISQSEVIFRGSSYILLKLSR